MLTASLLAIDFSDPQVWIYVVFTLLGLLGAIFGKKKEQPPKDAKRGPAPPPPPPREAPPPAPRTQQHPPPRAPRQAPGPAPARPVPQRAPVPRVPAPAPAQRGGPRPGEPRRTGDGRTPAAPGSQPSRRSPRPVEVMAHAAQTVEPAAVVGTSPTAATPAAAPVPALERRRTSESGKRARALLRSKPDLRAAFVLSEVLAPPVALRENHLL